MSGIYGEAFTNGMDHAALMTYPKAAARPGADPAIPLREASAMGNPVQLIPHSFDGLRCIECGRALLSNLPGSPYLPGLGFA